MKAEPMTPAQFEQLGKIAGLGPYHFGMQVDDLPKGDLAPNPKNPHPGSNEQSFMDTNTSKVTWGGLHPDQVYLRFYYGKLVAIWLHFHEATNELLPVNWAVLQKYGIPPAGNMVINSNDGSSNQGNVWRGGSVNDKGVPISTLEMRVDLPSQIYLGAGDESMAQKADGEVELYNFALANKLALEHHDALEQSVLQSHDLEKIKKDL